MQDRKGTWRIACAAMVVGVCFAGAVSAQQFRLIAGGDGDGGPALQTNLAGAGDAVYDSAGNLYVSQPSANRIRKITPTGTITTVVGGVVGFSGDGGPASAAKINGPKGLEIDGASNLYFADSGKKWQIVGVGDFDGDGASGLSWRNATTGANQVWRSGNSATQLVVAAAPAAWKLQGVGDFDGDGHSDLFWRNATTGQDAIWNHAFSGAARAVTAVTDLQWKVVATGDYDGDGKDDLLWRHMTKGTNAIWRGGYSTLPQTVTGVTGTAWTIVPYSNQP